ncbi:hypothetical protein EMCRGX_G017715 [Ephydatia muelleri]
MAVPAVLSPQVVRDEKHKVDEALRYIKAKLAEARTLERRKCLGKYPYLRHKFMPTRNLATSIVQSISGVCDGGDLLDVYCRHLALFRLFIRHCTNFKIANHVEIHLWIGLYYSDMDEEKWENVMQDDITYDYPTFGHGMENVN